MIQIDCRFIAHRNIKENWYHFFVKSIVVCNAITDHVTFFVFVDVWLDGDLIVLKPGYSNVLAIKMLTAV